ncbi:hypothetical protein LG34_17060 [Eubacterium ramulus]|uniref:Sigma-70 family RNA polymerase sigma factor n=1 Tax=Eubacterium ramulus TaxID=39490 RepID=A0A2V1JNL3_EUBRA|nr:MULTISPECIES: sigma-70 family RNA polymerase sigma factor [Clostridia]PWE85254.1 hypothetical protein LG34_17060 [Eubacterium ramulus]RHV63872.1 sigma-70 family RNA polymerase sigma factor [Roseburia sp. OM02-15]
MLYKIVVDAKNGDQDAKMKLINKFMPVIRKCSRKLYSEDAENEMILFILELIPKIPDNLLRPENDGKIVNYISISVKNHYSYCIRKKMQEKDKIPFSDLSEEQLHLLENELSTNDEMNKLIQDDLDISLSEKEYKVIVMFYFEQYSIAEIAEEFNVSRQAVNQMRCRAINKLRKIY